MTASRDKQVGRTKSRGRVKLHGAPREQRRNWQRANQKSWSRRPGRRSDGWL